MMPPREWWEDVELGIAHALLWFLGGCALLWFLWSLYIVATWTPPV